MRNNVLELSIVAASLMSVVGASAKADFSYSFGFGMPPQIVTNGSTQFHTEWNTLLLTNDVDQKSSMWYDTPQNVSGGFTTTFSFYIWGGPTTGIPGDGFAFVLHDDPRGTATLGGGGSDIGYGDGELTGIVNSLAIEFDTFNFEGNGPQVAIHTQGALANNAGEGSQIAAAFLNNVSSVNILDGQNHTCTIEYTPGDEVTPPVMVVYLDNQLVLSENVDLQNINGDDITNDDGNMYVGFTASTGLADSIHVLPDWGFAETFGQCRAPNWHVMGWSSCGIGCYYEIGMQVVGSMPQDYVWYFDGQAIGDDQNGHYLGLNSNQLRIDQPTLADNGYYKVVVTNACGSTESLEAFMGTCPGDLDDGTMSGNSDGGVDINDLLFFLTNFELGSPEADLTWQYGGAIRDNAVDINDLLFFLQAFEAGC